MKTYRIGVIGAGARAETFTRGLATGIDERASLFGICDVDEDRLHTYAEYCGHTDVPLFTDPGEFLNHRDMDAVVITVPEFAHREVAAAAMAAGKHIYLEKAMAPTSAECREIIEAHAKSSVAAFLGFNMRASPVFSRIKEIVDTGILGQVVHISALEHCSQEHGAAFMRRFHRHRARSGGFLNTKCSHDLDFLQWLVGHDRRVAKVASFGGTNVFVPSKQVATHCHLCPRDVRAACPYEDRGGFTFPVSRKARFAKKKDADVYGGDLCVYNDDKDIIDNQTVLLEWDRGVRADFNLQLFGHGSSRREVRVYGEKARLDANTGTRRIRVTVASTGEVITHDIKPQGGGHGGADRHMIARFVSAIEGEGRHDSGLAEGLAATLVAEKADEAMMTGRVVVIAPEEYA